MRLLLLIPFVSFLLACGNDDEPEVILSRTEMLVGDGSKTWQITDMSFLDANCTVFDDNTLIFNADGTVIHDEGSVTEQEGCKSDFGSFEGTWEFYMEETGLAVWMEPGNTNSDLFDGMTIKEFTNTKLVLQGDDDVDPVLITLSPM